MGSVRIMRAGVTLRTKAGCTGREAEHWAVAYQCTNSSSSMRGVSFTVPERREHLSSDNEGMNKVPCVIPVWAVYVGKCSEWIFCDPKARLAARVRTCQTAVRSTPS
jgi:hypothetical protein